MRKENRSPVPLSDPKASSRADRPLHNPGHPLRMALSGERFIGFSIAALSTYLLMPERNCAFDMGDCLLEAAPIEHIFLTHAHGDHARCLLRHHSLRRLLGMREAHYYVPRSTLAGFLDLAKAWETLQSGKAPRKMHAPPQFVALEAGMEIQLQRQLSIKTFAVDHTLPSLGYTLHAVRKKLLPAYQHHSGLELAALRKEGVLFEEQRLHPLVSFIGDSLIETLYREQHIGQSQVLFVDMTYLMDGEQTLAHKRGHTHIQDFVQFLRDCPDLLQNEHIVFKHFSMRYQRQQIIQQIKKHLPPPLLERVVLMV